MFALDMGAGKVWVGVNGVWAGDPATNTSYFGTDIPAGTYHAYHWTNNSTANTSATLNAGAVAFNYAPPSGFSALGASSAVMVAAVGSVAAANTDALTGTVATGTAGLVGAPVADQPADTLLHGDDDDIWLQPSPDSYQQINAIAPTLAGVVATGVAGTVGASISDYTLPESLDYEVFEVEDDTPDVADDYDNTDPDQPWDEQLDYVDDQYEEHNGSTDPVQAYTLSGVSGVGAVTPMNAIVSVALAGVVASGSVGSIVAAPRVPLTSASASGQVGTLTPSSPSNTALTGVAGTGAAGTAAPGISVALTGNAASGAVGSLGIAKSFALTNVAGTGAAGALAPSHALDLTGAEGTGGAGAVAPPDSALVLGVASTAQAGTLAPTAEVAITGTAATGSAGSMAAAASSVPAGVASSAAVGSVVPTGSVALAGVALTGAAGSVNAVPLRPITGVQGTLFAGNVEGQSGQVEPVSGVATPGQAGSVVPSTEVALSGVEAAGAVGSMTLRERAYNAPTAYVLTRTASAVAFTRTARGFSYTFALGAAVLHEPNDGEAPTP